MDIATLLSGIWGAAFLVVIAVVLFARRGRRRVGSGAAGSAYDWQTRDQRRATDVIVEERAAARDAEDADGNLPELERPDRPPTRRDS